MRSFHAVSAVLVPGLILSAMLLGLLPLPAMAAEFTVSNETELLQAIDDANASPDTSSTITLANSFTIAGSGLAPIDKDLIIDMAGHTLTASFDTTFNVAQGATLTLDGALNVTGTSGVNGNMIKTGEGTLQIKGGPSDVFWRVKTEEGLLVFDEGAVFTFGDNYGDFSNTESISEVLAGIRVTGPGTVVTNRYTTVLQAATGSKIDVKNGAIFNSKGVRLAATPNTSGTLEIDDAQVTVDDLNVQVGTGVVHVENGADLHTTTVRTGVVIDYAGEGIEDRGGTGIFRVTGKDSRWTNDGFFMLTRGSLSVLDGGSLETASLRAGYFDNALVKPAVADILVSGVGSTLNVTGAAPNAFIIGGGIGPDEKRASLTVANRGAVTANDGHGTIHVATAHGSNSMINIGGGKGERAKVAGQINAGRIEFGPGGGELNFNHTDNNYGFDIPLVGQGELNHVGPGRTTLTADQRDFTGLTTLQSGTLTVNGVLGGSMELKGGGRLTGVGTVGPLRHEKDGVIAPGNPIGQLTIDGDYSGNGGLIEIQTVLGSDDSPTDRLKITGDTTGTANISVTNLQGNGAPTVEGIKIIHIDGASSGLFSLQGSYLLDHQPAIVAGAYAYRLYQNGTSTPTDGDWYLRSTTTTTTPPDGNGNGNGNGGGNNGNGNGNGGGNNGGDGGGDGNEPPPGTPNNPHQPTPLYQAGVPLYQNYPGILQTLNHLPTLQQRTGNRHQNYDPWAYPALAGNEDNPANVADKPTVWTRINTAHARSAAARSTVDATEYSLRSWRFDAGIEGLLVENGGRLIGGISGHHLRTSAQVSSAFGNGDLDITGTGAGATLTWYGEKGVYLDGSAQATWYKSDLRSTSAARMMADGNHGFGYALSAETGVRINLNDRFSVIPQAQLTYSSVTFDTFVDGFGATISPRRSKNLTGRLGLEANYENFWEAEDGKAGANIYSVMNLHYGLHGNNEVNVSGVNFYSRDAKAKASLGLGGSLNWGDGKFTLHGEVSHQFALTRNEGRNHVTRGQLGLKIRF